MPNLFDEFDIELQKIEVDIIPYSDSCSDSIAACSSGTGVVPLPSDGITCINSCD